jgi:hypothetical protein
VIAHVWFNPALIASNVGGVDAAAPEPAPSPTTHPHSTAPSTTARKRDPDGHTIRIDLISLAPLDSLTTTPRADTTAPTANAQQRRDALPAATHDA